MRNPLFKGGLLIALGYLPVLGCGGGEGKQGGELDKGGGGGSAATSGTTGKGGNGGSIPIGGTSAGGSTGKGGSAGTLNEDTACISDSRTGNKAVVALYFMVDISGSMNCPVPEAAMACMTDPGDPRAASTRWTEASQAYKDFFNSVSAADNLWAGISFFSGNSCNESEYGPDVEIDALPGNASDLGTAIDGIDPNGNTPTVPSLSAAIDHARDWMSDHGDHQGVVVYATDGYPRGCDQNNTIDDAVTVAGEGYTGMPSVPTYVLAIGPNLTDLGRVATAGGTNVIQINTGMDVGAQLIDALNDIRDNVVIDCAYTIPSPPPGQSFAPGMVNVSLTNGSGETVIYPADANCTEGWRYDNPTAPTQILLCGSTCDMVQADPGTELQVLFGCQTFTEPP